jgi:hypothetical protein
MYKDITTKENFPQTLIIRNHLGGMIWQVYHVQAKHEAEQLANTATKNGFYAITLEDYDSGLEETWPDWRETEGGKKIIENTNK